MSRTRMFGTLAAVVACAGLVAGCGGGGYTAAESAPTSTTPAAPAAAAAPAGPTAQGVIGSFAQSDPASSQDQTFSSYTQFPKTRAGKIFVAPAAPVVPTPTPAPVATPAATSPVTTIPTAPAPTTITPTPVPVATQLSASLDVSGVVQTVVVGNPVPAASPQFTVASITATTVTLKINTGTVPGGGTTVDLTLGNPVTLSNATTGTNLVINVKEIKAQV